MFIIKKLLIGNPVNKALNRKIRHFTDNLTYMLWNLKNLLSTTTLFMSGI